MHNLKKNTVSVLVFRGRFFRSLPFCIALVSCGQGSMHQQLRSLSIHVEA